MSNEEKDRAFYKYPGTDILRNKLDIHNKTDLEQAERNLVTLRAFEGIPGGRFDLKHLQDILTCICFRMFMTGLVNCAKSIFTRAAIGF